MVDLIGTLNMAFVDFVLFVSTQPWVYLLVLACVVIDSFFPVVPSETIVIALASIILTQDGLDPWILMLVAFIGAIVGDLVTYTAGRVLNVRQWRLARGPKRSRGFAHAERQFHSRGSSLVLMARFIPVGRTMVSLAAGTIRYPTRKFLMLTSISATVWAAYTVGIGMVAGQWFEDNWLLGVLVATLAAAMAGVLIDRISQARLNRPTRRGVNPA